MLVSDEPADEDTQWESCGTQYDRLKSDTVKMTGELNAGATATITATGATDLHVALDTGAWQVKIYELGQAHAVSTAFGDLTKALVFDNPAAPKAFTLTVDFPIPRDKFPIEITTNKWGDGVIFSGLMGIRHIEKVCADPQIVKVTGTATPRHN
jgi:hypothetical protein